MNRSRGSAFLGVILLCGLMVGCGDTAIPPELPEVEPFVGLWCAEVFTVRRAADPDVVVNVLRDGGLFALNVEPSGLYTATLRFEGDVGVEIGQLSVQGSSLTLDPQFPDPELEAATLTYAFATQDRLVLDGPTEFRFSISGAAEPATAHQELQRDLTGACFN